MLKKGVTVHLDPANYVSEGGADCSGYFDPAEKKFVCSTGKSFWFETYAHEYGHFTQWVDGVLTEEDEDDILWDWLVGGDYTYEAVKKSVRASQDIEADNEKRTVELIKKYGLPIDVPTYIQKSNAYILFYSVVLMTRRWSDGETPTYSVPEIYGKLPNDRILEASEYRNVLGGSGPLEGSKEP